jgi:hypothetical protein
LLSIPRRWLIFQTIDLETFTVWNGGHFSGVAIEGDTVLGEKPSSLSVYDSNVRNRGRRQKTRPNRIRSRSPEKIDETEKNLLKKVNMTWTKQYFLLS